MANIDDRDLEGLWARYLSTGDEAAMEAVVARTRGRLLAAARRIGRPANAEDCVQSAYLSLLRRGNAVRDIPVLPWLLTATVRLAYRRKAADTRALDLARRLSVPGTPTAATREELGADESELVRQAVEALPDTYRDAVVLHYLNGLTTAETSAALGIEAGALRVRLHRARGLLRGTVARRLALGLFLLPLAVRDRVRAFAACGGVGGLGLLKLPGFGVAAAAVVVALGGTVGAASGVFAATNDVDATAVVEVSVEAPRTPLRERRPGRSGASADEAASSSASGRTFVVEEHYISGGLKARRTVRRGPDGNVDHGKYVSWRPDGSKESEGEYENGLRTGLWTFFHENGDKAESGRYENGLETGKWTTWRDSTWGNPNCRAEECEYRDGVRHGPAVTWHKPPQKESEGIHVDGEQHGEWTFWDGKGRLVAQRTYREGELHGKTVKYVEGRKHAELPYVDGEIEGVAIYFDRDSDVPRKVTESTFRDGVLHGPSLSFHADGTKALESHFVRGVRHGHSRSWYPAGEPASSERWEEGRPAGKWTRWHEGGQRASETVYRERGGPSLSTGWNAAGVKTSEFRFGATGPEGTFRQWFDDGAPKSEHIFAGPDSRKAGSYRKWDRDGNEYVLSMEGVRRKQGVDVFWHANGALSRRVAYVDFRKHGDEVVWFPDGRVKERREWRSGVREGVWTTWDAEGNVLRKVRYTDGKPQEAQ